MEGFHNNCLLCPRDSTKLRTKELGASKGVPNLEPPLQQRWKVMQIWSITEVYDKEDNTFYIINLEVEKQTGVTDGSQTGLQHRSTPFGTFDFCHCLLSHRFLLHIGPTCQNLTLYKPWVFTVARQSQDSPSFFRNTGLKIMSRCECTR